MKSDPNDVMARTKIVIAAKAGIHASTVSGADKWVPACARTTGLYKLRDLKR
ncbi:MAG: hypothetical protein JO058_08490 [Alphaproteobacteria bacterium]|nr:hypothetical protein [Alphaproteobacteria bacterium]MBV9153879.1 hypothetical protein [Alphaproteobacteria bacterium]MBV9966700.1 hypothetical protein [Alphaproteobacteria bacterium]